jgi:hypothetical protein
MMEHPPIRRASSDSYSVLYLLTNTFIHDCVSMLAWVFHKKLILLYWTINPKSNCFELLKWLGKGKRIVLRPHFYCKLVDWQLLSLSNWPYAQKKLNCANVHIIAIDVNNCGYTCFITFKCI